MIYDWEKRFEYIDMMNVHIQHIWNAVPFARPESMKSIKNYHDIWDWCDGSNIDFDMFEKSVTMYALEKVSKISAFEIKIDNGYYNLISSKEHISFSGSNLLILLSELYISLYTTSFPGDVVNLRFESPLFSIVITSSILFASVIDFLN